MSGQTEFIPPDQEVRVEEPIPTLWRILVRPLEPKKYAGQIELTDKTQEDQKFVTVVGQVVAMGEQAFQKPTLKDGNNPVIGSWVLFATYGGNNIEMADGRRYRIMNDDQVLAVVRDPEPYRTKIV